MRVHFGHVNIVTYNKKKIESPCFNFTSLEELLSHSRTVCTFDRRYVGLNVIRRVLLTYQNVWKLFYKTNEIHYE